jgi:acyl carrier protein
MIHNDIQTQVHEFVTSNFIWAASKTLSDDESLVGSGVIDSTGVLELISFLESRFHITFQDAELISENFDSVAKITSCISRKLTSAN